MHHTTNDNIFSKITPESAYWIGFLMADGSVIDSRATPAIALRLGIKDIEQVEKFKRFTGSSNKIHIVSQKSEWANTDTAHFSFASQKVADDLASYGVVPRKSKTAKVIGLENNRDFWRGVVDGDGCISKSRGGWSIALVGSEAMCNQFLDFAKKLTDTKASVVRHKSIFSVSLNRRKAAPIIRALYENASIYLDRKFKKALQAISEEAVGKVSAAQRLEIKEKYKSGAYTQRRLAEEYGVSQPWVHNILNARVC